MLRTSFLRSPQMRERKQKTETYREKSFFGFQGQLMKETNAQVDQRYRLAINFYGKAQSLANDLMIQFLEMVLFENKSHISEFEECKR